MSLARICQDATCFKATATTNERIVAMIRKLGFLELNKYLKDNNIINRYKRNISLNEVLESAYSKTVSSMVRELIESRFTGDRKSTRLNSSHSDRSRMPSSA